MASGPITSWEIDGETVETVSDFLFMGSKITADGDCSHEVKRWLRLGRKALRTLDNILKSRDITLLPKDLYCQSYGYSSSYIQMWELDHKEGWALKNSYFLTVLKKTLESPLDSKEIKSVNPKGNQPWIFIENTDVEATIFWPPDGKMWLIGKDRDAGKDWRQKEKRVAEDVMVR